MRSTRIRLVGRLAAILAVLGLAGCGAVGGSHAPDPRRAALEHPTGATDLVLRYESGGGFVAPGFRATEAPAFSLYGDGTAIFRNPQDAPPVPDSTASPLFRGVPFQVAHLTEAQVQALLAYAIDTAGLGIAAPRYDRPIADAPTTVFTIHTGTVDEAVSINGLGIDAGGGSDAPMLARFTALAARLQGFGAEVTGEVPWAPDRYRGILSEDASSTTPASWPWTTISPRDFVQQTGQNAPPFPIRTMTPAEVALLGIPDLEGGLQGLVLQAPTDEVFSFRLRPLLPDERF
jgi:hypothetical protein